MSGERRAWAWVQHLRAGGTTPWTEFHDEGEARGTLLPGAIQLELARRLNQTAGPPTGPEGAALVDRVLAASAPGRGQQDLRLLGVEDERARFGPPPVDPATLPASELARLAVGVLADLVVERDPGPVAQPGVLPAMPWRRAFHLAGNPLVADQVRAALGRRQGRRAPVVVLLADDLGGLLSDLWTWRVQQGATATWPGWLDRWRSHDRLPPRVDLPRLAETWAARVGPARVHVVAQQHPGPEVARILGVRNPVDATRWGPSPDATDLTRRVTVALRLAVEPERRQHLLDHVVVPLLAAERGGRAAVPPRDREWVRAKAHGVRERLEAARYAVHGDLDLLLPAPAEATAGPTDDGVLDVALRTLVGAKEIER